MVISWSILVMNLLKDIMIHNFNPWFRGSTKMTVSIRNKDKALAYYAARDFVHLTYEQKFNVGFQMGFCDHYDAMREEELLEDYIFERVIRDKVLTQFLINVRRMRHAD
jgi:hypothetical protein